MKPYLLAWLAIVPLSLPLSYLAITSADEVPWLVAMFVYVAVAGFSINSYVCFGGGPVEHELSWLFKKALIAMAVAVASAFATMLVAPLL